MRKKFYVIAGGILILVLLITGVSIYSLTRKMPVEDISSQQPATDTTAPRESEPQPAATTQPVEKYREMGLSMGGVAYRLSYFKDGTYAGACAPEVTKPCEGLYTQDSGRPKAYLSVSPVDAANAARICTGQEEPSFTFTSSAGEVTQACETGISGRILYYNALLKLDGKNYQIIFAGETKKGVAYPNVGVYKSDLEKIFPTITLAR